MTPTTSAPVSVLISTHAGERPDRLQAALVSIASQTLPPREIVLVCDGFVGPQQERVIKDVATRYAEIVWRIVRLVANVGLGPALNAGLAECRQPYVARMDSDDIAVDDRLAEQLTFLSSHPEVDLLAGWHAEFRDGPDQVLRIKTTPEGHAEIVRKLIWRNVISHPTIMLRRRSLLDLGGYRSIPYLEDYDLYMRLIARGGRLHALQRPLVKVRTNSDQHRRRGGVAYLKSELRFRRDCYRRGNLSFIEFAASVGGYAIFRLMPASIRSASYRLVRVGAG